MWMSTDCRAVLRSNPSLIKRNPAMQSPHFEEWFAALGLLNAPQRKQVQQALLPAAGLDQIIALIDKIRAPGRRCPLAAMADAVSWRGVALPSQLPGMALGPRHGPGNNHRAIARHRHQRHPHLTRTAPMFMSSCARRAPMVAVQGRFCGFERPRPVSTACGLDDGAAGAASSPGRIGGLDVTNPAAAVRPGSRY